MVRHCLWKMSATPGACIKPGLVWRPLSHKVNLPSYVVRRPLCHKLNLPRCEALRHHLIGMTCDIFGTGQTNTLTLCYFLGKTYKPAHSSATFELLKSTRSTKLLEKLLTWAAHTFPWRLWQGRSLNSDVKALWLTPVKQNVPFTRPTHSDQSLLRLQALDTEPYDIFWKRSYNDTQFK